MFTIYTITDPTTGHIFYVGRTTSSLNDRLCNHICCNRLPTLKKLKLLGIKPIIEAVDYCGISKYSLCENYWIYQFISWGFCLENKVIARNREVHLFNFYDLPRIQLSPDAFRVYQIKNFFPQCQLR